MNESHNIMLSMRSQTPKSALYDSIFMKFKNRQSSSIVLEVGKVVAPGGRSDRSMRGGACHAQCLDLSAEYMSVFSF